MTNEEYERRLEATKRTWRAMRRRCSATASPLEKKYYFDRGIRVCWNWQISFKSFLRDMGLRPEGTSIDRKNNFKGYVYGNCRWATPVEQANNKRKPRTKEDIEIEMILALANLSFDPTPPGETEAGMGDTFNDRMPGNTNPSPDIPDVPRPSPT